jgi:FkbM family methyltransferase
MGVVMAETKATVLVPPGQIAVRNFDLRHGFRYRLRRAFNKIFAPSKVAGEFIVDTPVGHHTLSYRRWTSDEGVALQIFGARDYDVTKLPRFADLKSFLDRIHRRGQRPLIIDAGANIGLSSVFFAMHFPTALVVAVEPEGKNFDVLCMNAARFNIECLKAALSSQTGRARVTDPGRGDWGYQTEPAADGDVPSVTIDSLYQRYAKDRIVPFIVKIDIEGGEKDLFGLNTEWIRETPLLIVELHDWLFPKSGTSGPFLRSIAGLDRDFLQKSENVFSISNSM